jgi:Saccharopine dehydrogenase NADP binding domain
MRVLVIGGYGNFGQYISRSLSRDNDIHLIIAGRSAEKAKIFADEIGATWAYLDIYKNLGEVLQSQKPNAVIHTSGPFQGQGYDVAEACIRHKCHYIDLADGRVFVSGIHKLDAVAREAGVLVISGASSVPCLTSAILDDYLPRFQSLESIDYGIATAQKTNPGLATTTAILACAGKAFSTLQNGHVKTIYGWQDLKLRKYPELGYRLLGNCDIPDLSLFSERYKTLKDIKFRAGLEVPFLHLGLWSLSWFVRFRLLKSLKPFAESFYQIGPFFNIFGSDRSGFHMEMKGLDKNGLRLTKNFYIVTGSGHGPNIPCIPSILLTRMLSRKEIHDTGAKPCMGLITLDQYQDALSDLSIRFIRD